MTSWWRDDMSVAFDLHSTAYAREGALMSGRYEGSLLADVATFIADQRAGRFAGPYAFALHLLWQQLDGGFSLDDLRRLRVDFIELDISWDTLPEREVAPIGVARVDLYAAYLGDASAATAVSGHVRRLGEDWLNTPLSRAWLRVADQLRDRERETSAPGVERLHGSRAHDGVARDVRRMLLSAIEREGAQ